MSEKRKQNLIGVALRGVVMGVAEVVPGVSGGTIAFVTGIYHELVDSIARFGPGSILMLPRWKEFVAYHNLTFLFSLATGMILAVVVFAQLMQVLLHLYQPMVWGYFCGVIGMSVLVMGRVREPSKLIKFAPVGFVCGVLLMLIPNVTREPSLLSVFIGGAIAVCAWLLPAISGSFILLALGLYAHVIAAISQLHWLTLVTLIGGCLTGLLLFSRGLSWLIGRHSEATFSFFTGFMLGSLAKLWPWQWLGSDGETSLLSPSQYTVLHGANEYFIGVVSCFVLGGVSLLLLTHFTQGDQVDREVG